MQNINEMIDELMNDYSDSEGLNESFNDIQNNNDEKMCFTNLALFLSLIVNDIHHIHLHSEGKKFEEIHNFTDNYRMLLGSLVDQFAEIALEKNESIPNFTNALSVLNDLGCDYTPLNDKSYDWNAYLSNITMLLSEVIEALKFTRSVTSDESVISLIDDKIRELNKELNYKFRRKG